MDACARWLELAADWYSLLQAEADIDVNRLRSLLDYNARLVAARPKPVSIMTAMRRFALGLALMPRSALSVHQPLVRWIVVHRKCVILRLIVSNSLCGAYRRRHRR